MPLPPLDGHNRPVWEMVRMWSDRVPVEVVVDAAPENLGRLKEEWRGRNVRFHPVPRRPRSRPVRAVARRWLLPSTRRHFSCEAETLRNLARNHAAPIVLAQFITSAPVLEFLGGPGTVLSGHDCMSRFFAAQARAARSWSAKCHHRARRWLALGMERAYAHRAAITHVYSPDDAAEWRCINPRAVFRAIPVSTPTPESHLLRPWPARSGVLIWGTLMDATVVDGLRRLLRESLAAPPDLRAGWRVVGRVPESEARGLIPELSEAGVAYTTSIPDLGRALGGTSILVIPDTGGAGQKNRVVEGFAHGCCVLGLEAAFRGLPGGREGLHVAADPGELARWMARPPADAGATALAGIERHARDFSREAVTRQWLALFDDAGVFAPGSPGMS